MKPEYLARLFQQRSQARGLVVQPDALGLSAGGSPGGMLRATVPKLALIWN